MQIVIRTIGNRALYRNLAESYDAETSHRTATGAAARLVKISREARKWSRATGQWGRVEIEIDGKTLDSMDLTGIIADADEAAYGTQWEKDAAKRRLIAAFDAK